MQVIWNGKTGEGRVLALGTFDGVHRGHQELIRTGIRYARENGIIESSTGVFELEGGDAFALLGGFVADITEEDHSYVTFLDKWELDVGGIVDDCIEDTLDWYRDICSVFDKYGIGRAAWSYKEMDFGFVDDHMKDVIDELVKVI